MFLCNPCFFCFAELFSCNAEQHCRSTASMVASLRDRMITYCARFLSPGSVSEIVHGKINILEVRLYHNLIMSNCKMIKM